ncbi:ImuA family protein [Pseudogemmobacter sonorensis]|uniref:ImuA family protein n=1 Tax=Pseudogemmobacter sonorensis TaxID=2989681 RepID=UPI00369BCF81
MSAAPPPPLRPARVHEVCGPGAIAFAAIICAQGTGPVLWLRERGQTGMLAPSGLAAFCDPARLLIARTPRQTDTLAVAEEALRDGTTGLVVAETSRALNLREGRRLQLAAQAGGATGLCLIPEGMGSPAAETRWHCAPVFEAGAAADSTPMRWEIIKNKSGTVGVWHVRWDRTAHRLDVVSPAVERPGAAAAPG